MINVCEAKLPNTKYDRFFCEEYTKKIKDTNVIKEITANLNSFKDDEAVMKFEELISDKESEAIEKRD